MPAQFLLRSVLFVPGTRADRFEKALTSGADAVVFDLEDAVDPSRKGEARQLVGEFLSEHSTAGPVRLIRVNARESEWFRDDLDWLRTDEPSADAVIVPKTETAFALEEAASVAPNRCVIPLLETPLGILRATSIFECEVDIPAVLFGAEDLTAQLGVPRTLAGAELMHARSSVVLAAATIDAEPIDAVWVDLTSADALREDAMRARSLGFRGKMAIHPDQIAIINDVFSPTPDEIAGATRIVEAAEQSYSAGDGVFRLDDRMVDAPVIERAKRVLERAEAVRRRG